MFMTSYVIHPRDSRLLFLALVSYTIYIAIIIHYVIYSLSFLVFTSLTETKSELVCIWLVADYYYVNVVYFHTNEYFKCPCVIF